MNFDSLIARFELRLLARVRPFETELRASQRYAEVHVVSIRHADIIHAMGITCVPKWASTNSERLGLIATFNVVTGLAGRIDVQWSQSFDTRTGSGYTKKETKRFYSELGSQKQLNEFEESWHRHARLFVRVARRGHPSAYWLRWLHGAPRDQHGWIDPKGEPATKGNAGVTWRGMP